MQSLRPRLVMRGIRKTFGPTIALGRVDLEVLPGEVPSPANPPSGCIFHPRCKYAKDVCSKEVPPLVESSGLEPVSCSIASTTRS